MSLLDSLLDAITRLGGEALIMHVGERPYVVTTSDSLDAFRGPLSWGQVELSSRPLTPDAVLSMLGQMLPADVRRTLDDVGAIEHEIASPDGRHRFVVVAARGGDDVWVEVRKKVEAPPVVEPAPEPAPVEAVAEPLPPIQETEQIPQPEMTGAIAAEVPEAEPVHAIAEEGADAVAEETVAVLMTDPAEVEEADAPAEGALALDEVTLSLDGDLRASPAVQEVPEEVLELDAGGLPESGEWFSIAPAPVAREAAEVPAPAVEAEIPEPVAVEPEPEPEPVLVAAEGEIPEPVAAEPEPEPEPALVAAEVEIPEPVAAEPEPEPEPVLVAAEAEIPEPVAVEPEPEPEPVLVAAEVEIPEPVAAEPEPEPEPVLVAAEAEIPEPVAVEPEPEPEPALVAAEAEIPEPVAVEPEPEPEPVLVAAEVEIPEPVAAEPEPEPEPVLVAAEAEVPEPVAVEPEPEPEPVLVAAEVEIPEPVAVEPEPEIVGAGLAPALEPPRPVMRLQPRDAAPSQASTAAVADVLRDGLERGASTVYAIGGSRPLMRIEGDITSPPSLPILQPADIDRFAYEFAPRDEVAHATSEWTTTVAGAGRVRCVSFEDAAGRGLVFHLAANVSSADELGLSREIQALCNEPDGLVIVAGPRASGKSTLLAAFVDRINRSRADHIITIESRVRTLHERRHSLISQREVDGEGTAVARAARAALREGPDVLVIDDVRSPEAIAVAIDAARAGRLVFASMPAPNTTAAIQRLTDAFAVDRRPQVRALLSGALRGVVSQVLVNTAAQGRTGAREVLLSSPLVAQLILDGAYAQVPVAIESGRRLGMRTLTDSLVALVRDGAIEAAEAVRAAPERRVVLAALQQEGIDVSDFERLA